MQCLFSLLLHLLCNDYISLPVSWYSRSSSRSSGLSWPLCNIFSSMSQKHSGVKRMSGYSWKSEPKLCSTRLWKTKWLLKGRSRFVVQIAAGHTDSYINISGFTYRTISRTGCFVLTHEMLKLMSGLLVGPAAGVDPVGG